MAEGWQYALGAEIADEQTLGCLPLASTHHAARMWARFHSAAMLFASLQRAD